MTGKDYIALINRFWDLATTNPLSTGQVSLYMALLHVCNRSYWSEWFAAPNQVLSVLTGLSRSGILRARNELKQRGLIDFRERGTKATSYKLIAPSVSKDGVQECPKTMHTMSNSTQVGVQDSTQVGVQDSTQVGVQDSNTLKDKRQKTKQKSVSKDTPEKCAQKQADGIPKETLDDYIANLEALGKPVTGPALEMLFKRLEQLAPGNAKAKIAILEQSVRNGWKDVYPLNADQKPGGGQVGTSKPNRFHNFEQSDTSYDDIAAQRLRGRMGTG